MAIVDLMSGITFCKLAVSFKALTRFGQNDAMHYMAKLVQLLTRRFIPAANAGII
jgi:hypothetical protein